MLLLLLLLKLLLLNQLLLGNLRRGGNLGGLAVENDLGLFEVAAGICKEGKIPSVPVPYERTKLGATWGSPKRDGVGVSSGARRCGLRLSCDSGPSHAFQ